MSGSRAPARAVAMVVALIAGMAGPRDARADEPPSDRRLVAVGLALAVPTYLVGVTIHEGSHAGAAKLVGGDVVTFRPWPGRDARTGAFQLGLTRVRGLACDRARLFFYLAPKLVDVALVGAYVAYFESGAYPRGSYGQLVATVLATGFVVDFAKDTVLWSRHNDLVKAMNLLGARTELRRLPLRLVMAGASAGLGYLVWRGHERLFASNDLPAAQPLTLPLVTGAF